MGSRNDDDGNYKSSTSTAADVSADIDISDEFFFGGGGGRKGEKGGGQDASDSHVDENEPEIRRHLRAQRLANRDAKMAAALKEQQAVEAAERDTRANVAALKEQHRASIDAWTAKNKGNIRGLIVALPQVLWPGADWKPMGVQDLLDAKQVRKAYMKANLLVHPDKVRQRGGSEEQLAVADMVFDALKDGWDKFQH